MIEDDFTDLTPANTPVDSGEIRRMMMSFVIVPARLKKLKRLVDTYIGRVEIMSKVEDMKVYEYSLFRYIELDRMLKIKRIFGL